MRLETIAARSHCLRKYIEPILAELEAKGTIARLPGGYWGAAGKAQSVTGQFLASLSGGGGKVRVTDPPDFAHKEIYISPFQTGGAWHKDIVRVLLPAPVSGGKGKISRILERTQKEIPCLLETRHKYSLLFRPADAHLTARFKVPASEGKGMHTGDLAILSPIREISRDEWEAAIVRKCGPAERISAQEAIVKVNQQAPGEFPALALEQARCLPVAPSEEDMKDREDLRNLPFVTIDGADARDFDDAIYVEKTNDGYLLRVAIADVSHYVRPDEREGSLDAEALARGNSWYFPRSVEPMLPEALSNGLCSLRPDEDRLAMLAEIPFDKDGNPGKPRFAPIAMRSRGRLIYDDVSRYFETGQGVRPDLRPMLDNARELYELLAKKRRERGTLDFFLPEPAYQFDSEGKLLGMGTAERGDANMLIEEFMIAANEAVARHLEEKKAGFLYRVHPEPEKEKLTRLFETLRRTAVESLPPDISTEPESEAIQKILARAAGTPEEYIVNRLCLRSMGQARYQPHNIGHFGLASKSYCHFTSPIRRYADLLVHRALKADLGSKDQQIPDEAGLEQIGEQLNGLERRAIECEREIAKRLACIALEDKIGQEFKGTISGVTDFGVFVELDEMPVEGLIRMSELRDDWYQADESGQRLIGARTGRIWRLGQPVSVRVASVDLEKQDICLAPVAPNPREKTRTRKSRSAPAERRAKIIPFSGSGRPGAKSNAKFKSRPETTKRVKKPGKI